jgi:hypothetical protein
MFLKLSQKGKCGENIIITKKWETVIQSKKTVNGNK